MEERKDRDRPIVAPGDEDYLEKEAAREEKKKGEFTRVTTLSYDEVDTSPE